MKVDRINKRITPETAREVFEIWAAPSSLDYRSGGKMCANFAAQNYAGLSYEEACDWSLSITKEGHRAMFDDLMDAHDARCDYTFEEGEVVDPYETHFRPKRGELDPILRVAEAFKANPSVFGLEVYEDAAGMLQVVLTNKNNDQFKFSILDDYHIFQEFDEWFENQKAEQYENELKASADRFLAAL